VGPFRVPTGMFEDVSCPKIGEPSFAPALHSPLRLRAQSQQRAIFWSKIESVYLRRATICSLSLFFPMKSKNLSFPFHSPIHPVWLLPRLTERRFRKRYVHPFRKTSACSCCSPGIATCKIRYSSPAAHVSRVNFVGIGWRRAFDV
jgi:hypothetical protein